MFIYALLTGRLETLTPVTKKKESKNSGRSQVTISYPCFLSMSTDITEIDTDAILQGASLSM